MLIRLVCAATLAITIALWPGSAFAAEGGGPTLAASSAKDAYGVGEPIHLSFAVTNTSAVACGLAGESLGTVQITSVRRDGVELSPGLGRSFYLDGIANAIRAKVTSVPAGGKVDVPMTAVRVDSGTDANSLVLRSVTAMPEGGGLDALWPVGAPGRYEVTAGYAMPDIDGVTPCAGTTASKTVSFTVGKAKGGLPWLWIVIAAAAVLVLAVLVMIAMRRKRPAAGAAVVMLLLIALTVAIDRPAFADYEVDPSAGLPVQGVDFDKAVADCFAKFGAPGGDPAGIMPRLKDPKTPKVRIIPTTGGSNTFETPESKDGKGSSTITWNPTNTENYENDVARDPCSALYHELNHADDISKDQVPQGDCGNTGIKTAEVKATFAENKYRKSQGLDPRKKYDGKDLPKSIDDCKKKPDPKTPPKGPIKLCEGAGHNQCGSTNGDPHLVTFDKAYYDFQAVGEFDAVRSTSGDPLEVQTRQAPLGTSRTVSVNTAVAFRVGAKIVELAIVDGVTQIRIDHQPAAPDGQLLEARESDISQANGYEVHWPDGSEAAIDQIGHYGYRLLLKLSTARAGKVEGLLGNFDGDPTNDIAPQGGGTPLTTPVQFDKLYPSYADSWRVTGQSSLFTYASGQNTSTFTDRKFPEKPMAVTDLDAARRAQAEDICRWAGVTDAWQFLECVLDVGVTGRPEFAVGSASSELIAPPTAAPIAAQPVAAGTLTVNGTNTLTFTGKAGTAVFVDAFGPTIDNTCSPYRLIDPSGNDIRSGCNINGIGYIERTELKTDGAYTVALKPDPGITGHAYVRVYVAHDTEATASTDGALASVTLDVPGSVARLHFKGVAGQRVYFDVPESTLPNECSPLQLLDPNGTYLASGCVINGVGDIEGTLLPADGTYTVVVDPEDRTIGEVQWRLFMAKDDVSTMTVNGAAVVANIKQPGFVVQYQFIGTAGATITVQAADATLPNECSPLELRDPAGNYVASGCVINGEGGIDHTTLPVTGMYTILVDPRGPATGTVLLTLHS